ncbi:hypothetical protein M3Y99_00035600 [Aphelenchoides fujianensis]|nr:hypothetical protein M3Y99_00035600 [Aphelenchoides fujianensis]
MFDGDELIGIRLTSLHETPAERKAKFELLPDYKEVIDAQQVATREQKRLHAIIESVYAVAANYLPDDCGPVYFDMEMVSIKRKYRGGNLSMRLYQELFKLAASKGIRYGKVLCTAQASKRVWECARCLQVQYAKFLDDGEPCFQNTPDGSEFAQLFVADLQQMGYLEDH